MEYTILLLVLPFVSFLVLGIAGMVALFVTSSAVRDFGPGLFGSLPLWLTAGAVAIVGVSEGFLWHTVRNFIVK
mgnify:CR=1 FL=1